MAIPPEIQFAQRLAANEKRIRDRAVKKLKTWFAARSSSPRNPFTEEDMLKVWKGLFYCMWMSDKPLIQEELSSTISGIIHCFGSHDATLLYIKCFFTTMSREWFGIDKWRMDKFMMFVRSFLAQSFQFLKRLKWEQELIDRLLEILETVIIRPSNDDANLGLQLHLADIYVEELARVAANELSGKQLTPFLLPYCRLIAECKNDSLRKTVNRRVFLFALRLTDTADNEDESGEESETKRDAASEGDENGRTSENEYSDVASSDDDDGNRSYEKKVMYKGETKWYRRVHCHEVQAQKLPFPKFDYQDIGDKLLEIASDPKKTQTLRKKAYTLVKMFHEMAKGVFPLDAVVHSKGKRLRTTDFEKAAHRLLKEKEEITEENKAWKQKNKKKKRVASDDSEESSELDTDDNSESDTQAKDIQMKRKKEIREKRSQEKPKVSGKKKKNQKSSVSKKSEQANGDEEMSSAKPVVVDKLMQRLLSKSLNATIANDSNVAMEPVVATPSKQKKTAKDDKNIKKRKTKRNVHAPTRLNENKGEPLKTPENGQVSESSESPPELVPTTDPRERSEMKSALGKTSKRPINDGKEATPSKRQKSEGVNGTVSTPIELKNLQPPNANEITSPTPSNRNGKSPRSKRYFARVADLDLAAQSSTPFTRSTKRRHVKDVSEKAKERQQSAGEVPFARFEKFVKTPPAFFRKAVGKVTPNTLPKMKKKHNAEQGSPKKVNFQLSKNTSRGTIEFFNSVKTNKEAPFDASKTPLRGVLKCNK